MQLYARDSDTGTIVSAAKAEKQKNYICYECQTPVRMRGGLHRQNHFFHTHPKRKCSLHGKGLIHLLTQIELQKLINSESDCHLEYYFPEINRIADVVWLTPKIIFEIQCSPISAKEVHQRQKDYANIGFTVVWILHDHLYNQWRLSSGELAAKHYTCYYTNMNCEGIGIIYDQFEIIHLAIRKKTLSPLPIDITKFHQIDINTLNIIQINNEPLNIIKERLQRWSFYFNGDLIDQSLNHHLNPEWINYYNEGLQIEKKWSGILNPYQLSTMVKLQSMLFYFLQRYIFRPYIFLFHIFLERACKS